jgi:hypothetical protein
MSTKLSYHFTTEKAGMQGLDRSEIDRIIYENTKDSVITRRKEEERKELEAQVEVMKHKLASLRRNELLCQQKKQIADGRLKEIKNSRIFNRLYTLTWTCFTRLLRYAMIRSLRTYL